MALRRAGRRPALEELARVDERSAEQQVLAWWRAAHGELPVGEDLVDEAGRILNPLLVPVRRTGGVAAPRLALRHAFGNDARATDADLLAVATSALGPRAPGTMPSTERLRAAMQLANIIDAALAGNDDRAWTAIDDAVAAVAAGEERRREFAALEHLAVLADFRRRILALKPIPNERPARRDPLGAFRELKDSSPQRLALRALLEALLPRLDPATDEDIFRALEGVSPERRRGRGNKSVDVALARLMVRFRFPGRRRRVGETEEAAVRRVAKSLSDEWRGGRRARR